MSINDFPKNISYIYKIESNFMATYEMNIDTLNSSLSYYQAEKYIYGSSRLGMLKDSVNVLGSAFTDTDSINITHTLGNKRYELSNHLGNVLTVITDKPIPHNNSGTVDYWKASIASAYDYSPFGVMLTGRTFEGKQTICEDSTTLITQNALEEGFGTWGSWTAMAEGLVTYVADEMQVSNPSSSKKNIGTSKTFTTGEGLHSVSFVVIGNMCSNIVIWPPSSTPIPINVSVKDNLGNVVASGNYTAAGSYNLSFTPASAGLTYRIEFYMANASAFCFFRVDDVLVSYDDTTTVTVCKEVEDGYRYGFNGQEKDDQVSGKGNSYTAEFWQYDSRLGRRWNLDPKPNISISGYATFANNPIWFSDPLGDTIRTNSEGFDNTKMGTDGILDGRANPIGFNPEKGILTFDEKLDISGYTDVQKDILGRYKELITNKTDVNLKIVDINEKVYKGKSLFEHNAVGLTVERTQGDKLVNINVFVARNPIKSNGETPEKKEYAGITNIHEAAGHAFLYLTQPTLKKNEHNKLVEDLHKTVFLNYKVDGVKWYRHSPVPTHTRVVE